MVGYTHLMRADEEGTFAHLRADRIEIIEPKIAAHRGRIVKLMGDGWLVEFASVVDAVRCATEIQTAMAAHNAGVPEEERIVLRIGINLGDVIVEGEDIHGDGVNVAARMQEIAPPGGISVSGVVYDSVRDKLAPEFVDLGPQKVKNLTEPVRAYQVVLDPEAAGRRDAGPQPEAAGARQAPPDPQPAAASAVPKVAVSTQVPRAERVLSVLSGVVRRGAWRVPKRLRVVAAMGGADLDFREAQFGPGVSEMEVIAVMGGISVVVPPDLQVECEGIGIMGAFEGLNQGRGERDPDAPCLRITGIAVMGALEISTRGREETMKADPNANIGEIGRR